MGNDFFHKIDPEGDVLLILHTPCAPFAVWDVSEETSIQDLNAWSALPTQVYPSAPAYQNLSLDLQAKTNSIPTYLQRWKRLNLCFFYPRDT
ncbi:hypothetical protein QIS74_13672 [Colletotrichum tabaci]|uniref:Uncharacterized protein n=1 Tax=Colletotrichum tabaci TaxID=1209068 RepID=A0AAV9SS54_9PEZI